MFPGWGGVFSMVALRSSSVALCGVSCGRLAVFAALLALALFSRLSVQSARAACSSNTPADGDTVVCTGTDTAGVFNATGDNITVTVQQGATIDVTGSPGSIAIQLRDFNAITNFGSILGDGGWGIYVNDGTGGYRIINVGKIDLGTANDGVGIQVNNDYTIINSGTIRVGGNGNGIVGFDGNTITNSGTITVTSTGNGISVNDRNTITNSGRIEVDSGIGINANDGIDASSYVITNSGTIVGGATAIGIRPWRNYVVNNTGSISVGANGLGIGFSSTVNSEIFLSNTVTNSGSISVGDGGVGIGIKSLSGTFAGGAGRFETSTITNNGTITAGSNAVGIGLHGDNGTWDNNSIKNNGTIIVGANSVGIGTLGSTAGTAAIGAIENNGTIRAGANGISIGSTDNASTWYTDPSSAILNNGTLDGRVNLPGAFNVDLQNTGLITITDAGTPVGAEHLIGNIFQQFSTGTLALRVTRDDTVFDKLKAEEAYLAGTLKAIVQPGLYGNTTTYLSVIDTNCGCVGTFDQTVSSSPFFGASSTVNGDDIDLTLTRIAFGAVSGMTINQQNVGKSLDPFYSTGLTGNAATFFGNLLAATSLSALDALSGEGTAATQNAAFTAVLLFNGTLSNQLNAWLTSNPGSGGALAYAQANARPVPAAFKALEKESRTGGWRVWLAGFFGKNWAGGENPTGSADSRASTGGGAFGADYQAAPDLLVGFAAGASQSNFAIPDRATDGELLGGHLGVYAAKTWGAFYTSASASYARFDNATNRTISGVGPTEYTKGRFASDVLGGRLEFGYRMQQGVYNVTPFAAIEPSQLWQRAYTETSLDTAGAPGILGLSYAEHTITSLPLFVGAQVARDGSCRTAHWSCRSCAPPGFMNSCRTAK